MSLNDLLVTFLKVAPNLQRTGGSIEARSSSWLGSEVQVVDAPSSKRDSSESEWNGKPLLVSLNVSVRDHHSNDFPSQNLVAFAYISASGYITRPMAMEAEA
jgi:hypothetical protein